MEDDLGAADGVVHALVAMRSSPSTTSTSRPVEVRAAAGREVVEHAHLVAALEQRAHEVRADEPGAAGDERLHGAFTAVTWKFANSAPGTGSRSSRTRVVERGAAPVQQARQRARGAGGVDALASRST